MKSTMEKGRWVERRRQGEGERKGWREGEREREKKAIKKEHFLSWENIQGS